MSKPLFFTGRKELRRSDVQIRLKERAGEATRFQANIDVSRYGLPSEAQVIVEAYHNAYLERFAVGTVEALDGEITRELRNMEPGDRPHFRVKVTAPEGQSLGCLLAAIDQVRPDTQDDGGASGSLLPIVPKTRAQMGDEFWRLNFIPGSERLPELWVNQDVPGLFAEIQNQDPKIVGLVMPEVLRQVLKGLVGGDVPWTEDGQLGQWLLLAQELYSERFEEWDNDDVETSLQKRLDWIDEVVRRFAASHRLFDRYQEQQGQLTAEGTSDD